MSVLVLWFPHVVKCENAGWVLPSLYFHTQPAGPFPSYILVPRGDRHGKGCIQGTVLTYLNKQWQKTPVGLGSHTTQKELILEADRILLNREAMCPR